jgi:two-component system, NarL family, capsular synthesis sensor histidine kinase RcsC
MEEGTLILHTKPMNLKALIRSIAGQYINAAKEKGVILLLAIDPRIPEVVLGEKVRLRQVLTILIANGIQFAESKGGTCAVMAEVKNNVSFNGSSAHVRVAVRDDGPGFEQDDIDNMFRAYVNLTPSHKLNRGLGMGLCVARQIVELHGGSLNVDTAPGRGSTFYLDIDFVIPAGNHYPSGVTTETLSNEDYLTAGTGSASSFSAEAEGLSSDRMASVSSSDRFVDPPASSSSRSAGESTGVKLQPMENISQDIMNANRKKEGNRIAMVVDDALPIRKLLKKTLERIGFRVDICDDGDVLVEKVLKDQMTYDVIFLDNMMPRLRGVDAIRILRAENYRGLVIGVTGNVLKEDLVEFLNAGCDDVLAKPVDVKAIIEALKPHGITVPE